MTDSQEQDLFMSKPIIEGIRPTKKITYQEHFGEKSKYNVMKAQRREVIDRKNGDRRIQSHNIPQSYFQIEEPLNYPYSTMGYIKSDLGYGSQVIGTGCLVGPNLMITAAHNVRMEWEVQQDKKMIWNKNIYNQMKVQVYLGAHGAIDQAARRLKVKKIYFPKEFQTLKSYKESQFVDYAILQLDTKENLTKQFGCLGILTNWENIEEKVNIFGYAADRIRQKVQKQQLAQDQQYAFLFGEAGNVHQISGDGKMIRYHQISTSFGQSGCPIFIQSKGGQYFIVGVHRGADLGTNTYINIGIRITETVQQNINNWLSSLSFLKRTDNSINKKTQLSKQQQQEIINKNIKILQHFPQDYQAHRNLARAYRHLGNYQEAINSYKMAIKIKPNKYKAHYNLGLAYQDLDNYEEAINSYMMAIEIKPSWDKAHYNLGNAYRDLGNYEEAINSYKMAIEIKPNKYQAHYNLGLAYRDLGNYEEAINSFKMAIKIKPSWDKAHYSLGNTYSKIHNDIESLECYKMALKLQPDNEKYKNAVDKMRRKLKI